MTDHVAVARRIAPLIEAEAQAGADEAGLTTVARKAILDSGLLWMHLPKEIGGGGALSDEMLLVVEEISRADPSAGWVLMAAGEGTAIAYAFTDDPGYHKLFANPKHPPVVAGLWAPLGTAVASKDGHRINGRYQFGSGVSVSTHVVTGVNLLEDGKPVLRVDGTLEQRSLFTPRENVEFLGGWDVTGLKGTASYDYAVSDYEADWDLGIRFLDTVPRRGGPFFGLGCRALGALGHGGVALGIMKRALEEVASLTHGKRRSGYSVPVDEFPVFLDQFARNEAKYQAAKSYLLSFVREVESNAAGSLATEEQKSRARQAVSYAHDVAGEVVAFAHLWGGTQSIKNPTVLGRLAQDLGVTTQHLMVDPASYSNAAPALLEAWRARSVA